MTTQKDSKKAKDDKATTGNSWNNQIEFLFACISYAIGLGNVWRFPYLVYRNGGGAFLVPYILMVFLIGIPIFFSELFVGQYSGLGPNKAYEYLAPFFHGLGYCTLTVITIVTIYYMVIISWIIFYFVVSLDFGSPLSWGHCDHDFNTEACYTSKGERNCMKTGNVTEIFWGGNCTSVSSVCASINSGYTEINKTHCDNVNGTAVRIIRTLASEEYYNHQVLGKEADTTWENFGYPRWQLLLCLAAGWLIAFLCLSKGIKGAGKTVFFTVTFPYVVLTAFLIRSLTLEGAIKGVQFYVSPKWEKLLDGHVWGDAASQLFYSFGLGCSSLVTFASYSKFKNNLHTDTLIVSFTNIFTAIFCGFSVFATLGFMANNLNVEVDEVVQSGPGLAFIAYPEAMFEMPLPRLWAILFFSMMFILGMGSQFGGIEAVCLAITEQWPHLENKQWRVTAGVCFGGFIAGIPMTCNGGIYLYTLLDWHTASWAILLLGIAEVIVLSWVYGIDRIFKNLTEMDIHLPKWLQYYWWSVLMILTPITSFAVFVFVLATTAPTNLGGYLFPAWADSLGWLVGTSTLTPFVIGVAYHLIKGDSLRSLFQTSELWRPQESKIVNNNTDGEASCESYELNPCVADLI